jgi:hypothetical protein
MRRLWDWMKGQSLEHDMAKKILIDCLVKRWEIFLHIEIFLHNSPNLRKQSREIIISSN